MSPIRFTNMFFNFIHLPVSHLSNSALPFHKRFTRVPSVKISCCRELQVLLPNLQAPDSMLILLLFYSSMITL